MPSHDPLDDGEDWDDPSWDDLSDWDDLDEGDSADAFSPPPHPDDRIWRHPAEVAAEQRAAAEEPRAPLSQPFLEAQVLDLTDEGERRSPLRRNRVFALATTALMGAMVVGGLQLAGDSNPAPRSQAASDSAVSAITTAGANARSVTSSPNGSASTSATGSANTEWRATLQSRVEPGLPSIEVAMGGEMVLGGGIVIDHEGHIMTSAQLVKGATHIIVRDGDNRHIGELVGTDLLTDVAVIHIDGLSRPPASLGVDENIQAGQYALTTDEGELTVGQITKVNDELELDSGVRVYGLIETTLNAAHSLPGTAIFDDRGLIIGMTPWTRASDVQGHAVPIALADRVARQIVATGTASHAWLGIQGTDADIDIYGCLDPNHNHTTATTVAIYESEASSGSGVPVSYVPSSEAAAVMVVQDRSPAQAAGLEVGDLIVSLADLPVRSMSDLVSTLRTMMPGDEVSVTYKRDGELVHAILELGEVTD